MKKNVLELRLTINFIILFLKNLTTYKTSMIHSNLKC